jgi:uncharacterized Zn finger protein
MDYGGWKPYVSVAARRKKAEMAAARAKKAGAVLSPIESYRGAIAKTFWGKAWCNNLEGYSDYANRLPRGRTYTRNGSVIDLQITAGEVRAQVMGSRLYTVTVNVSACLEEHWHAIGADCSGSIDSIVELLQGKLSTAVMERICKPVTGLFPAPKEITFSCSCPDWASMCKHVAAVLYGVGARLDRQPEVLFALRRVDANDLVGQVSADLPESRKRPAASKVLDDAMLADVFGIEMAEAYSPAKPAAGREKPVATKVAAKKAVMATRKPRVSAETAAGDRVVEKKLADEPAVLATRKPRVSAKMLADDRAVAKKLAVEPTALATRKPCVSAKTVVGNRAVTKKSPVEVAVSAAGKKSVATAKTAASDPAVTKKLLVEPAVSANRKPRVSAKTVVGNRAVTKMLPVEAAVLAPRKSPASVKTAAGTQTVTKKLPVEPPAGRRKSASGNAVAGKAKAANASAAPEESSTKTRTSARLENAEPR